MDPNDPNAMVIEDVPTPTPKAKKLKPARKQVKAGDVVKTEAVQTGKEYSKSLVFLPFANLMTSLV